MKNRILKLKSDANEKWKMCDKLNLEPAEILRRKAYWEGMRDAYASALEVFGEELTAARNKINTILS